MKMSISTAPSVTIGPGVQEFLRRNDAEAAFQTICEIIRECFPETRAIGAQLEEDHDIAGWWRIVVSVTLPDSIPTDTWLDQHKRYHERRGHSLTLSHNSLFVTRYETQPE
jgi:hypothetical protein